MTDLYAKYTRLRFERPHPLVLRITMNNGKMNTAYNALHGELAEIWRDVDRDRIAVGNIHGCGWYKWNPVGAISSEGHAYATG